MFVDQKPFVVSTLEAIGLTEHGRFAGAGFQYNVYPLDGANDPHVAVQHHFRFEDVDLTGLKGAEYFVEHPVSRFETFGRKRRDVIPQGVPGPVARTLGAGHGFSHLLNDCQERFLILRFVICFHIANLRKSW